jgi:hypothetical protein
VAAGEDDAMLGHVPRQWMDLHRPAASMVENSGGAGSSRRAMFSVSLLLVKLHSTNIRPYTGTHWDELTKICRNGISNQKTCKLACTNPPDRAKIKEKNRSDHEPQRL